MRAAWCSTIASHGKAPSCPRRRLHAWLTTLLGPAATLAGIALPDAVGFEELQAAHASAVPGAPAASWIHVLAITLAGFVVLPRGLLALFAARRASRLARRFVLPLADPYFQRLLQQQRADIARVYVLPYAQTPSAQAALGLRALLAPLLGEAMQLRIAPTLAFGAEDDVGLGVPADTTLAIALFDLTATPEAENHGRFIERLAASAPPAATTIVLIDEAGFVRRFGAASDRVAQRREAWRRLAARMSAEPAFADLEASLVAAGARAIRAALAAPVHKPALVMPMQR